MATDVEILTAAREVAAAVQAVKDADQAKLAADREAAAANDTAQAARKRYQEAEGRLVLLSRQKPAEGPAEPLKVEAAPVAPAPVREPLPAHYPAPRKR